MKDKASGRRNFLRRFGIGAAGAAATVATSVLTAKAAPEVVEKIVEVPVAGGLVWAREAFGYGTLQLEEGEVFALTGLRNDNLLTGQGYARMVGKLGIVLCNCGRRFVFDIDTGAANYMVDHCARTGHRPANLARPLSAVTVRNLEERLRAAVGLPPVADLVAEPDPVILQVGGTLRPSLIGNRE